MAAITFPFDLLAGFPGWQGEMKINRRQEQSRTASGRTLVKDLGDPLWVANYVTKSMRPNMLDTWRARLDILDEGMNTFKAYVLSRCYPILYPKGSWPTGSAFSGVGTLSVIGVDRKEIQFSDFPAGYVFTAGDVVMLGQGTIYRIVRGGPATASVEVRPNLKPNAIAGMTATVKNPWCLMAIDPGSRTDAAALDGRGQVSFSATEAT